MFSEQARLGRMLEDDIQKCEYREGSQENVQREVKAYCRHVAFLIHHP